jgi:hypothetical protein
MAYNPILPLPPVKIEGEPYDQRPYGVRVLEERPAHLVPSSTPPAEGIVGKAVGRGCPRCGGLRQHPMACVIGLPDAECPAPVVDVVGAGEFVGHAGKISDLTEEALIGNFAKIREEFKRPVAEVIRYRGKAGKITATIKALRLDRADGRYIPSYVMAGLYKNAVEAEMSESVSAAVSVSCGSIGYESANKLREYYPGKKALVEVRANGMLTDAAIPYMFELCDAIIAVIESFEPPEGAWVADEKPLKTGDYPMEDTENGQVQEAAAPVASAPAGPQLDMEAHAVPLAQAAASVHYPIEEIETRAVQYLNDAKQFIAMFNMALSLFQSMIPPQTPAPQQPAQPPVHPAS